MMRPTLAALLFVSTASAQSLDALQQQAVKAAVRKVAPSVVQIETSGGTDVVVSGPRGTPIRKAVGPTTGLIVAADGYVISSSYNFANKPTSVFVAVPGHKERFVARTVATDKTRMLTLLKIDATGLPVPQTAAKGQVRIGHTVIALGRTLDPNPQSPPSVSVGIVSALDRIWGRALQTDAKVSPANYGGPLVDIAGRVVGILIPADPNSEGATAGVEYYDAGIGFAVPLDDVNAALPRLKQGKDLGRGLLGITAKDTDIYGPPSTVANVAPDSAAAKAGIQVGDVFLEIDGKPIRNHAQLQHALGTKYEGDKVSVKVKRGSEEKTMKDIVLGGVLSAYGQPVLGILPVRDDPEPGVEVRFVYPKGPADTAGVKEGDRITKIGGLTGPLQPFSGRDHLAAILANATPGNKIKIEVVRKEGKKTETIEIVLGEVPPRGGGADEVPDKVPEHSTIKKALEPRKMAGGAPAPAPAAPKKDDKKAETGLLNRKSASGNSDYWLYVPRDYDPNTSYALVVWLHPVGKNKEKDIDDILDGWIAYCREHRIIVAGPLTDNANGWQASDSDLVLEVIRDATSNYTVDRRRVVVHGMGVGGQLALYMAFHNRDTIRGVAVSGAALEGEPKEKIGGQPLAFFFHAGEKDPLAKAVAESRDKLTQHKYAVVHRETPAAGHQYLDEKALDDLARWIDALDRL